MEEVIQDTKGLAGLPLFCVLIVVSFLLGQIVLSAQLVVGLILAIGLTVLIRTFFFEQRPVKQKFNNYLTKIDASSFPSLHSIRAGVLATLLILHVQNLWLGMLFAFCALAVAAARVIQKRHFIHDVIAGLMFGVIIAFASVKIVSILL